jgi:hypothetical protein
MRSTDTARHAELLLEVLRGEKTVAEAQKASRLHTTARPRPCRPGPQGLCVTHGQPLSECARE